MVGGGARPDQKSVDRRVPTARRFDRREGGLMRRALRAVVGIVITVPGFVGWSAAELEAAPPRCFGKRATIIGTANADNLIGTDNADVIVGLGGNDRIEGRGGNDRICGNGGRDLLAGSPGQERLNGGPGSDGLVGGSGPNVVQGGAGPDTLWIGTSLGGTYDGGGGTFDVISFVGRPCATGVRVNLALRSARWPKCPNSGHAGTARVLRVEGIQGSPGQRHSARRSGRRRTLGRSWDRSGKRRTRRRPVPRHRETRQLLTPANI
jgi:Ca2+-binding RTX toxin-like protein